MHCMGLFINFVLFLLWFGIYLHLVTTNKNLNNLLKAMLSFKPLFLISLTHHMNSHLWWVHAHYFPQVVERWTCVSSPLLSHTPHRRRTGGSRGATQRGVRFDLGGISQSTLWRQGWTLVRFIFISYFVRLPLCNKYSDYIVTFISIHSIIICVVFFGAYMRCTRLYPLNLGVTKVVSE
jgi:hypothetical protein